MTKVSLARAKALLEGCNSVIWDDDKLCYHEIDPNGPEDIFLKLSTVDNDGMDYEELFSVTANPEVDIVGSSMFLINTKGEVAQLTLLKSVDLEAILN